MGQKVLKKKKLADTVYKSSDVKRLKSLVKAWKDVLGESLLLWALG